MCSFFLLDLKDDLKDESVFLGSCSKCISDMHPESLWMGLLLEVYTLDFEVVCLINHLLLLMELGEFQFISCSLEPDTEPSLIMHGNLLF